MSQATHGAVPAPADNLHTELRSLIASSRQRLAGAVNAELTRLYWTAMVTTIELGPHPCHVLASQNSAACHLALYP